MPQELKEVVGSIIREMRQDTGLSQEALAEKIGIHRTYMSDLERGIRNPTIKVFCAIARALDVKGSAILAAAENIMAQEGARQ